MALKKRSNNLIGFLRDRVRWYSSSYELWLRQIIFVYKQIIFCKPEHETTYLKSTTIEIQKILTWKVVLETLK